MGFAGFFFLFLFWFRVYRGERIVVAGGERVETSLGEGERRKKVFGIVID